MIRRRFLISLTPAALLAGGKSKMVRIVEFDANGNQVRVVEVEKIEKTDAEWKASLLTDQYKVLRREGTEMPFSGKFNKNKAEGIYVCAGCSTALFDSKTKFDSGTGWPSYWAPIAKENVHESRDVSLGMLRISVECARCGGHLGHVFDDGPEPTGLRYCMNSAALNFVPRGQKP